MFQRNYFVDAHGGEITFPEFLDRLRAMPEVPLLVVDPARKYLTGDEDDAAVVSQFFEAIERFAHERNTAVIVVHHLSKGAKPTSAREVLDELRGSQVFIDLQTDPGENHPMQDAPFAAELRKAMADMAPTHDTVEPEPGERLLQVLADVVGEGAERGDVDSLERVGQLAAGVAHEINNPIGFVHANLQLLSEYVPKLATALRAGSCGWASMPA